MTIMREKYHKKMKPIKIFENYKTKTAQMKNYRKLFITLLCLGAMCAAHAENTGIASGSGTQEDPWVMNGLTATVECPTWNYYYVQFIPTEDATVTLTAEGKSGGCWLNEEHLGFSLSTESRSVKANTTYTVKFNPNGQCTLTISIKSGKQPLEVIEYGIEPGSVYGIAGGSSGKDFISFLFNEPVDYDAVELVKGDNQASIPTNPGRPAEFLLDQLATDSVLISWLEKGVFDSDSTFTVKITGLHKASDETSLYGEDGVLSVDYKCNNPVRCLREKCVLPNPLLSYYKPGDPAGIVKIVFNGELKNDSVDGTVEFNRGATNAEEITYVENIKGYAEGNTVTFDLSGKLRHSTLMTPSKMRPGTMDLRVGPVYDPAGHVTYTEYSGSPGTYTFTVPFKELNSEIMTEFPQKLEGDNIEIWISPIADIEYMGISFAYTAADGSAKNETVEAVEAADPNDETAATLTAQIPAGVKTAKEGTTITVSLAGLSCIDGMDHSNELTARYNSDGTSSLSETTAADEGVTVYNLQGILVLKADNTDALRTLESGAYIVNGKVLIVK